MSRKKSYEIKARPSTRRWLSQNEKPCPTCYSPMRRNEDGDFACRKHGVPTRR